MNAELLAAAEARAVAAEARAVAAEARGVAAETRAVAAEARAAAADARIVEFEKQVAELTRNASNSSKPPSSRSPAERLQEREREKARAKQRSNNGIEKKKRGAQPGHKGAQRALVPAEEVDDIVDHFPTDCEHCWRALPEVEDANAQRAQTWELPPIVPEVIEHRFHAVTCTSCAHMTAAPFSPPPVFGPRVHAMVATLTGHYHVSRRRTVSLLSDLMGFTISPGAVSEIERRVSESLAPAVREVWEHVDGDHIKHTDGTSWFQNGVLVALWTIAISVATVFKIVASGDAKTLKLLLGDKGIMVSDRATALRFWAMHCTVDKSAGRTCYASSSGSVSGVARARLSAPTSSTT